MRSNFTPLLVFRTVSTVRLMSANTPMLDRIIHSPTIMTTPAMPTATDNRNDSFITDHGSTRETLSLTRRGAAGRSLPGIIAPPAARPDATEAPPRTAVPVWPTVLTRCLLHFRPHYRPLCR